MESLNQKIQEAGKTAMVLMVNEAKSLFKKEMSEAEFLNQVYGTITESSRTKEGVNYFKQVYSYLAKGMTDDEIFKHDDGKSILDLCDKAKGSKSVEDVLVIDGGKFPWGIVLKVLVKIIQIIIIFL